MGVCGPVSRPRPVPIATQDNQSLSQRKGMHTRTLAMPTPPHTLQNHYWFVPALRYSTPAAPLCITAKCKPTSHFLSYPSGSASSLTSGSRSALPHSTMSPSSRMGSPPVMALAYPSPSVTRGGGLACSAHKQETQRSTAMHATSVLNTLLLASVLHHISILLRVAEKLPQAHTASDTMQSWGQQQPWIVPSGATPSLPARCGVAQLRGVCVSIL